MEMLLFSYMDLDKLRLLNTEGNVRNLMDRREDVYKKNLKN